MRIGALAEAVGASADTIRWYERSGILRGPRRAENRYRDYRTEDVAHLRLLVDLRRLDVPLQVAATLAASCHAGHCAQTGAELPVLIAGQRAEIAARIDGLRELDNRLADLGRHLGPARPVRPARDALPMLDLAGPCCDAAAAVIGAAERSCSCCSPLDGTESSPS